MQKVWLYLENGDFFEANSFGADTTCVGKLVFNTSFTAYQESITDPSSYGLFISFNTPEIGNVGINKDDFESNQVHASGVIVRSYNDAYSNFRAEDSLASLLKSNNKIGICDIDTRYLTKLIKKHGNINMIASTTISFKDELAKKLKEEQNKKQETDIIDMISTKEPYVHKSSAWNPIAFAYEPAIMSNKKIVVIDFGVKKATLNELVSCGLEVEVVPASFDVELIIQRFEQGEIGGVVLSNGPELLDGLDSKINGVKKLISKEIPMFAIGLGHQIVALSYGVAVETLGFVQHIGSHPIKVDNKVEISSQAHTKSVSKEIEEFANISHTSLFDSSVEGLRYKDRPIISVQYIPEAHDTKHIFKEFASMVKESN